MQSNGIAIFTLIELLIVITIIVILLSILLPAFTTAKDMSRGLVCKNNLKQLGIGMETYIADFNGRLPCAGGEWAPIGTHAPCAEYFFLEYLGGKLPVAKSKAAAIYKCPGRDMGNHNISCICWGISYGMNGCVGVYAPQGRLISYWKNPSRTIFY